MEELTVVSGQLEDSLRQDIESYVESRLSAVRQELSQLQSQLNESLSRLLDQQGDVQLDGSVASSIAEHLRAAHEEGVDLAASESSRAKASSDMALVKAAISDIDEQRTQTDILKLLVNRAAAFAPRVAFFVIKGQQVIGWRARGFQGSVGDEAIRQISFSPSADTVVREVSSSKTTWSGGPSSQSENHLILNRLGEEPPQRIVAIPLVVRSKTVAVLYADSAALDSEAINLEALETLVQVSAMAVELLAARTVPARRVEHAPAHEAVEQTTSSAYVPSREYEAPTPEPPPPPFVEQHPEPQEMSEPRGAFEAEPETYEITAPSYESAPVETAPPSAPSFETESPSQPLSARRRYGMDQELPVEVASEEERRLHNDARRFARLLVSEIKLYNEQKVLDGRSQHDLYERLREYIDRSREMYDKRVKPEVARKYDYFHHELVGTLAEGDAEKLGNAYPGATVSA
jgi:hypothetical protein